MMGQHLPTRRQVLKGIGSGGAMLAISSLLPATDAVRAQESVASKLGVAIPEVNVRFGMSPFGDHSIYSIGIRNNWFKDVGITIGPGEFGLLVPVEQAIPLLVTGQVDIDTYYGSSAVQTMEQAPQVRQFTFADTYVGIYILAPPQSGAKTVEELIDQGVSFDEAMNQVVAQMVGKRLALGSVGGHRKFFNDVFELAGVAPEDVDVLSVDDPKMVQMGRGGQIDFASPEGAAQNVELLTDGWYPIVSIEDLIRGLPVGDPRGVGSIGHTGLATTADYYANNKDTCLRMASVMFRIIDAIHVDIEEGTDEALSLQLPFLNSAAGTNLDIEGLKTIFTRLDPLKSFEEQVEYWIDSDNPFYYANVYQPQIEAVQEGGILSKDKTFTPDDVFLGKEVYEALLSNREQYDELLPQAEGLSGDQATLAEEAAVQYANRNYLDAYRFLNAAVGG